MKKLFAISFLFIYLFTSTELNQLLKVPLLIEHFMEHRDENKHLTLWQFLYIHYGMGDVKDADYEKDMKLPFKTHSNSVSSFSNVYLPPENAAILKRVVFLENKIFKAKDRFTLQSYLSNIWQPPKAC